MARHPTGIVVMNRAAPSMWRADQKSTVCTGDSVRERTFGQDKPLLPATFPIGVARIGQPPGPAAGQTDAWRMAVPGPSGLLRSATARFGRTSGADIRATCCCCRKPRPVWLGLAPNDGRVVPKRKHRAALVWREGTWGRFTRAEKAPNERVGRGKRQDARHALLAGPAHVDVSSNRLCR